MSRRTRKGSRTAPGVSAGKRTGLCILFAAAYSLGTPGYDLPGLPFVCLVPLIAIADSATSGRQAARWGLLAGSLANLPLFSWIAYTVAVPGNLGWGTGAIAALLVSVYVGVYASAAAAITFRFRESFGERGLLAFPAIWAGTEYARSVLLTGFPWMLLGYGLAGSRTLRQAADLGGVFGLGFLLAATSAFLYLAGVRVVRGKPRGALLPAAAAAAAVLFLWSYGSFRAGSPEGEPGAEGIVAGIAQGGIDQSVKWDPAHQVETLEVYRALSREARTRGAEVILWPETAAPFFYGWEQELSARVEVVARETGVPLLFGAPWFEPSEGGRYYNSVFHIDARGVARGRYDKQHLVPFGEYIPLRSILFFLKKLTVGEEDFSAGTGPSLFDVGGIPVGASVCYEAIFPGVIRESVREGAALLVNVTNDAWFGDTVAPKQHLAMARMRAAEFRRPMVRAANSGISAIFDDRGEEVARIDLFRRAAATGRVHPGSGETIYAKTGEIFAVSCTIITLFGLAATFAVRRGARAAGQEGNR